MMGRDFTVQAVEPGYVALTKEVTYLPRKQTREKKVITVVSEPPLKNEEIDIR
jgi:hypothetical protein